MNEKPESPVGVYGNLCVIPHLNDLHPYNELICLDIASPSPAAPGVALGGDSRMSPVSFYG